MVESSTRKRGFIVGAIIVLFLVIGASIFSIKYHQDPICERVIISITDDYHLGFVRTQDVCTFLKRKGLYPQDKVYSNINCYTIETSLRDVEVMIRSVECYKTTNNEVVINICVRKPIMEVLSERARYFVDEERKIIPYHIVGDDIDILRVRGKVEDDFASGKLFDFVQWVNTDTYWRHKISNIKVLSTQEVEFYLKALPVKVSLGDICDFEPRMKKLQTLLIERDTDELRNYSEIDLRFHSQVVCRK